MDKLSSDGPARKERMERFDRVAERRTVRVLKSLRSLGNCGNRHAYEYASSDVEKIFRAIEREVEIARSKFRDRKEIDFRLR